MPVLTRDPAVFWRVEKKREELALRILAGEAEGDADALGTMTLLAGGVMHQLNLLGGEIWKLCDGTRDRAGIVAILKDRFDAGEDVLAGAVDDFLDDMIGRKLVSEERP